MVMPAGDAPSSSMPPGKFAQIISAIFGGSATQEPPQDPNREPKDDPRFVAKWATAADSFAQAVVAESECPCKKCKITLFVSRINEHLCGQVVAAAFNGDTSKLQAILDLVEQQKKST